MWKIPQNKYTASSKQIDGKRDKNREKEGWRCGSSGRALA
jgi:hypothetical protein